MLSSCDRPPGQASEDLPFSASKILCSPYQGLYQCLSGQIKTTLLLLHLLHADSPTAAAAAAGRQPLLQTPTGRRFPSSDDVEAGELHPGAPPYAAGAHTTSTSSSSSRQQPSLSRATSTSASGTFDPTPNSPFQSTHLTLSHSGRLSSLSPTPEGAALAEGDAGTSAAAGAGGAAGGGGGGESAAGDGTGGSNVKNLKKWRKAAGQVGWERRCGRGLWTGQLNNT